MFRPTSRLQSSFLFQVKRKRFISCCEIAILLVLFFQNNSLGKTDLPTVEPCVLTPPLRFAGLKSRRADWGEEQDGSSISAG